MMPIAYVNRIVFVNKQSVCKFGTTHQPIEDWHIFFHNTYTFCTFLLGRDITNWNRMTDSAVVFRKLITTGKHPLD